MSHKSCRAYLPFISSLIDCELISRRQIRDGRLARDDRIFRKQNIYPVTITLITRSVVF